MIISHKYRYLFIEIPLTASWAIHHELCQNYAGEPILHKHATYPEFQRNATKDELGYYVFAAVRNPLDKIVSRYYKIRHDQKGIFSNEDSLGQLIIDYSDIKKYEYIKGREASFEDYFRKFYKRPYSDMVDLSRGQLDFVIRYEDIQRNFSTLLMDMGIKQIRPLPITNKTPGKSQDFLAHYTPRIINQAKRVCGPFMSNWSYQFPDGWGNVNVSTVDNLEYKLLNLLRYKYVVHLRYSNTWYSIVLRRLRAMFLS